METHIIKFYRNGNVEPAQRTHYSVRILVDLDSNAGKTMVVTAPWGDFAYRSLPGEVDWRRSLRLEE
jgi:hypothetical protein